MDITDFENEIKNDEILFEHKELLKKLAIDSNTVCVMKNHEGEFYLQECCDEWYKHILTKQECLELSVLFEEISKKL